MSTRFGSGAVALVVTQTVYNGGLAVEVVLLARWLEAEPLGLYFYALSLAAQFEVGVHWGAQYLVNREAAARFDRLQGLLPSLLAASAVTVAAAMALVAALHGPVLAVIAGSALVRAGTALLGAVCIGRGRFLPPALSRVVAPAVALPGLWLYVGPAPSLERVAVVVLAATLAHGAPMVLALAGLGLRLPAAARDWVERWRLLLADTWPYVLLFSLGQLLYRADATLLTWLWDEAEAARFMLAFKWVEGFFFLPHVVASATIPAMVAAARQQGGIGEARTLTRAAAALAACVLALAALLRYAGEPVLRYLLGDAFLPSVPLFRAFAWLLPVQGLAVLFGAGLIARHRERALLALTAAAAAAGLAARLAGARLAGVDGFAAGVFIGLGVQALGNGWVLWRTRPQTVGSAP